MQTVAQWLVLLLGLGFFLGWGPRSFAGNDELGVLDQQALKLFQQGKYQQAIPIVEKALAIVEKEKGPEDPDTAKTLNRLALLHGLTDDYAKAEPLFQRALQIREKVLGLENPDTATSLNELAGVYDHLGDYTKAEPLYQQALQIRKKALGPVAGSNTSPQTVSAWRFYRQLVRPTDCSRFRMV